LELDRPVEAEQALRAAAVEAERLGHAPSRWAALAAQADSLAALGREAESHEAKALARALVEDFAASLNKDRQPHLLSMPDVASILRTA
jgi:hypothetical protein